MPRPSFFDELMPIGMRLIDLDSARHGDVDHAGADERRGQVRRLLAANRTACRPWSPAVDSGRPAASHAVRVTLKLCSPTWLTQPPTTWPIVGGIDPRALHDRRLHDAEHARPDASRPGRRLDARWRADGVDDHNGLTGHRRSLRGRPGGAPGRDRRPAVDETNGTSAPFTRSYLRGPCPSPVGRSQHAICISSRSRCARNPSWTST